MRQHSRDDGACAHAGYLPATMQSALKVGRIGESIEVEDHPGKGATALHSICSNQGRSAAGEYAMSNDRYESWYDSVYKKAIEKT